MKKPFAFLFVLLALTARADLCPLALQIGSAIQQYETTGQLFSPSSAPTIEAQYQAARASAHERREAGSFVGPVRFEPSRDELLYQRWERGESHARGLVQIGWQPRRSSDGTGYLESPDTLAQVFVNVYRASLPFLANHPRGVPFFLPSLTFVRQGTTNHISAGPEAFRFVRPGIDPWPGRPWIWSGEEREFLDDPLLGGMLPIRAWVHAHAEGKTPTTTLRFIDHDLAHLTELLFDRELSVATARYYLRRFAKVRQSERASAPDPKKFQRSRVYGIIELMMVPDISQQSLIRELVPELFSRGGVAPTIADEVTRLQNFEQRDPKAFAAFATKLFANLDRVVIRQGGGARDSYNLEDATKSSVMFRMIENRMRSGDWGYDSFAFMRRPFLWDNLLGLAARGAALQKLAFTPEAILPEPEHSYFREQLLKSFPGKDTALVRDLFFDHLARIECALYEAVRRAMTPAKLLEEGTASPYDKRSDTARYFAAFASPESVLYEAFVE